ncbi:DUF1059 domain-containing protein [Crenobacter cavernae]|uniref:DUF1059 domain-containing protein n=1 Tax=Crenobacter cavernae TaxID=2290923 RepID=A0A345Y3H2_9NEIS|nr:DUF1059 domain-containing protein [Crenobacter cavernae]AXK38474.1 DUF1059 domain-containing protein [Crenobacter cavernae]
MGRLYIDCREYPSESHCSLAMSADSAEELLEAAVQHAVAVHQHQDTPEFRQQIRQLFKEGTPPVESPPHAWDIETG